MDFPSQVLGLSKDGDVLYCGIGEDARWKISSAYFVKPYDEVVKMLTESLNGRRETLAKLDGRGKSAKTKEMIKEELDKGIANLEAMLSSLGRMRAGDHSPSATQSEIGDGWNAGWPGVQRPETD
jgi:hypothetical protein